jgi:hypothetical protein
VPKAPQLAGEANSFILVGSKQSVEIFTFQSALEVFSGFDIELSAEVIKPPASCKFGAGIDSLSIQDDTIEQR